MNLTDVTTKLKQSLPVFHKENLKDNPKNDILETIEKQRDFTFLRGFVKDIFQTEQNPELSQSDLDFYSEINDFTIKTIKRDDSRHKHVYTESYLPFNIYNDSWLTKYFTKILKENRREQLKRDKISADIIKQINKQAKSQYPSQDNTMHDKLNAKINEDEEVVLLNHKQQIKIPEQHIREFIQTDEVFNEARNAFALDISRAQIKYMMNKKHQPNQVLIHHQYDYVKPYQAQILYHPGMSRFSKDADKLFRRAAFTGLTKNLKLDPHIVEIALEKYAPLWREQMMIETFNNQYLIEPTEIQSIGSEDRQLKLIHDTFLGLWLRLREYEYGQAHYAILKELNLLTPNMKLNEWEVLLLKEKVAVLDTRYREIVKMAHNKKLRFNKNNTTNQKQEIDNLNQK